MIWDSLVGFDEIPQLLNPSSGWIASTNQDPFKVTDPSDNLNPKDFSPTLGLQTRMTNRAYRAIELFGEFEKVDEKVFDLIKFDNKYSKESRSYKYITTLFDRNFEDEDMKSSIEVLRGGTSIRIMKILRRH